MEKLVSYHTKLNRAFLLTFEVALLLRLVILYSLIDSRVDTLLFSAITVFGGIVFLINVILWIRRHEVPNIWLIIFILAMVVSSFLNGRTNLVGNLRLIVWQVILFFVIFYSSRNKDEKMMRYFENILFVFWTIAIIISLGMFVTKFSYVAPLAKIYYGMRLGFFQNRLYGVFVDPNFAANVSAIVVLLLLKRMKQTNLTKKQKIGFIVLLVLNFCYIVLSGSRTVLLESAAIVFVGIFFYSYSKYQMFSMLKRWLYAISIGLISMVIFLGGYYGVKVVAPHVTIPVNYFPEQVKNNPEDKKNDDLSLVREDVADKEDASNGRLGLWKSAVEIFLDSPIYGTSPRNLVNYAEKNLPDTRIAHSKQTPHNFLLFTLAGTGLIGIIPLLIFLFTQYIGLLAGLFKNNNLKNTNFLFYSLLAMLLLIFGLFMPDIIFENRIGALCFWLYLGTASYQKQFIGKEINNHAEAKLTGSTK